MKRFSSFHRAGLLFVLLGTVFFVSTCGGGGGGSSTVIVNPVVLRGPTAVCAIAGDSTVTISWSIIAAANSYDVYRSISSGSKGEKIASSQDTLYTDSGLTNGTTYYYIVNAVNSNGVGADSRQVSATPTSNAPGIATISGIVQYQDKEYNANGFTGTLLPKAVRYATVELVNAANSSIFCSALTDSNGVYSITTMPTATVYVRVDSEVTFVDSTHQITVKDLFGSLYSVTSGTFMPDNGANNIDITIPAASIGGAFNIIDVFTNGFQFVNDLSNSYPPALSVYWQPDNLDGTYYCTSDCVLGEGIYVLNDSTSGDTDEYDDDVLLHEFGHFVANKFSIDQSPGGYHYLNSNDEDLRLSWSEGWGDFFPGAVKAWLSTTNPALLSTSGIAPSEYVDTLGNVAQIHFDFGSPGSSTDYMYASSEVATAKVLLAIRDSEYGMQPIWDIVNSYQSTPPQYPVNLEAFWDRWRLLRSATFSSTTTTEQATMESIFSERRIYYKEDQYEPDDTYSAATRTITLPFSETHYLYKADNTPDKDVFQFNADSPGQSFTIQTLNLYNGADTSLTILDGTGAPTSFTNDNWNNISYQNCDRNCPVNGNSVLPQPLSSKLTFVAPSPGAYYVEVKTSPELPPSAGRYGAYTLTITSP